MPYPPPFVYPKHIYLVSPSQPLSRHKCRYWTKNW